MSNNFHNISSDYLADEFGNLKAQADSIDERLAAIKAELIARGDERVEGPKFTITISKQSSTRLDTKELENFFGTDALVQFKKTSESTVVRVKPTAIFGQAA